MTCTNDYTAMLGTYHPNIVTVHKLPVAISSSNGRRSRAPRPLLSLGMSRRIGNTHIRSGSCQTYAAIAPFQSRTNGTNCRTQTSGVHGLSICSGSRGLAKQLGNHGRMTRIRSTSSACCMAKSNESKVQVLLHPKECVQVVGCLVLFVVL